MDWMRLRPLCLLALALAVAPAGELAPAQRQRNVESFEKVWATVHDRHWDTSYNGVNWQGLHEEFRPRVKNAGTTAEARAAMQEMLARLKQTHFNIVAAEAYEEIEGGNGSHEGAPGLDIRLLEGQVIITSVQPGSPAAEAGIQPGLELRAIDGKAVAPTVEKITHMYGEALQPSLIVRSVVRARLQGPIGSEVKLTVAEGGGKVRTVGVRRAQPRGVRAQFGYLPPAYVSVESRRPAANVGYVAFNLFLDPDSVMKAVGDAVSSCMECDGFILDLRGNPGGIGGMAMGIAGWFVETPGRKLGTMVLRDNKLLFAVSPRGRTFRGRLAVLVDACSASTSEILAGGLQDLGRARIFGTRTAGAALPSMFEKLPNGDGFQYAFANYISESGKPLEGNGVAPDTEAPLTRKALLEGRDPALEAALKWIGTDPKKG